MIIKTFEINKINLEKNNLILQYGKNDGLKKQIINKLLTNQPKIFSYEEKDILNVQDNFLENILNKSLFEEKKIILIKRATDKILKIIEEIKNKNINDIVIVQAENLERKSKLRSFFEKDKELICIPFYPDNEQTLLKITFEYFKQKKISISQSNINQIINKSAGDRQNLLNELEKIEYFLKNGKKVTSEIIFKLINLPENISISDLIDNYLANNKNKVIKVINENNYTNDDCILILRSLLNKSKKILQLSLIYKENKNIELTITKANPPIFWKDKEITKQQLKTWNSDDLKKLIYKLNDIELIIKKNLNNSLNIITNFLLEDHKYKISS
tara:strand:+ start:2551 stop:3540 length:990 start_codon:yes stop_codon:yes gene_type:complete